MFSIECPATASTTRRCRGRALGFVRWAQETLCCVHVCSRSTLSDPFMDWTLASEGWPTSTALGCDGRSQTILRAARAWVVGCIQGDDMDSPHDLGAGRLPGRGLAALILLACAAP